MDNQSAVEGCNIQNSYNVGTVHTQISLCLTVRDSSTFRPVHMGQFNIQEGVFMVKCNIQTRMKFISRFQEKFPLRNAPMKATVISNYQKYKRYETCYNRNKRNSSLHQEILHQATKTNESVQKIRENLATDSRVGAHRNHRSKS